MPELPSQLIERLCMVDLVLHASDLVELGVLDSLRNVARTVAVYDNADPPAVARVLRRKQLLVAAGRRIGLIHGNRPPEVEREYLRPEYDYDSPPLEVFYGYLLGQFPEAEIIVFGHLNVPVVKRKAGRLLINPGSVAPHQGRSSFCLMELEPDGQEVEIVAL
jgi:putative phosphoesterase